MRIWLAVSALVGGCSSGPSSSSTAPTAPGVEIPVLAPALATAETEDPLPGWAPVSSPTPERAGASRCTIVAPVELGPHDEGEAVLAFDAEGGMAAWKSDPSILAVRPIASDGAPLGPIVSVKVPVQHNPRYAFALRPGFLVVLATWDWQESRVFWSAVLYRRDKPLTPPIDMGLDGMQVRVAQVLDERRIGLIVAAAPIAKQKRPGRWQTVAVTDAGEITTTAVEVNVEDLVTTTDERFEPALHEGRRGWIVLEGGVQKPEGVFDGRRLPSGSARPLLAPGELVARVHNQIEPIPRSAAGQYEPLGNPVLMRSLDGRPVGEPLRLQWQGSPVGAYGSYIQERIYWSGTHFLFPHWRDLSASVLPIHCRPT